MNDPRPATISARPLRDQVQGRKLLEDAHRIGRAQHGYRAGQPDAFGSRRGGCQDNGRGRVEKIAAMVLPYAERVESDLIGELHLFKQVAQA
jgi:hypothetical protein